MNLTEDELAANRQRCIDDHVRNGWEWDGTYLHKGTVTRRPSEMLPFVLGDVPAYRLGFWHVGYGRFYNGTLYADKNGMLLDEQAEECHRCGGANYVKVRPSNRKPAGPWDYNFVPCPSCQGTAPKTETPSPGADTQLPQTRRR